MLRTAGPRRGGHQSPLAVQRGSLPARTQQESQPVQGLAGPQPLAEQAVNDPRRPAQTQRAVVDRDTDRKLVRWRAPGNKLQQRHMLTDRLSSQPATGHINNRPRIA